MTKVPINGASGRDPALHSALQMLTYKNMLRFPKRRAPWLTA
jgi:hypothetical protein